MSILIDWKANKGNPKGRFVLLCFRLAALIRYNFLFLIFLFWFLPVYVFLIEWLMGIELKWNTKLGSGIQLWHGQGLVINSGSVIGNNCTLRHNTTIGNKDSSNKCPVIGNNVNIGTGAIILGDITIGDNVIIAAGSIVVKSFEPNVIIAGNPAKIIKNII